MEFKQFFRLAGPVTIVSFATHTASAQTRTWDGSEGSKYKLGQQRQLGGGPSPVDERSPPYTSAFRLAS